MVFPRCCVPGCNNKEGLKHRIPFKNKERLKIWLKNINSAKLFILGVHGLLEHQRVCEHHFEDKYKATSNRLTMNAIPTLYLQGFWKKMVPLKEEEDDQEDHNNQPDPEVEPEEDPEDGRGGCVNHDHSYAAPS